MWVAEPVRESFEEIETKYDGYCVLVVECDQAGYDFGFGKAIAYDEDLATLTDETIELLNDDMGIVAYKTFTDFGTGGPIQVVHYD